MEEMKNVEINTEEEKTFTSDIPYDMYNGQVTVRFKGDEVKNLRFTFNALCKVEEWTGVNVTRIDEESLNLRLVRALLLAGFLYTKKRMNLEEIGNKIDVKNLEYYFRVAVIGIQVAMGNDPKEIEEKRKEGTLKEEAVDPAPFE